MTPLIIQTTPKTSVNSGWSRSVADRGFGDQKLYRLLTEELYFDYVIRFRGNIAVTASTGETRTAAAWVRPHGRARVLRGAAVTAERYPVGTVVCVQDTAMKQAWCLAASSTDATAKQLTGYYGRRWGIECGLRDTKDLRFGMGMGAVSCQIPRTARSVMVDQCFRSGAVDVARCRR